MVELHTFTVTDIGSGNVFRTHMLITVMLMMSVAKDCLMSLNVCAT